MFFCGVEHLALGFVSPIRTTFTRAAWSAAGRITGVRSGGGDVVRADGLAAALDLVPAGWWAAGWALRRGRRDGGCAEGGVEGKERCRKDAHGLVWYADL